MAEVMDDYTRQHLEALGRAIATLEQIAAGEGGAADDARRSLEAMRERYPLAVAED